MKTFMYRGYDCDGHRKKGVVEAHDLKDARDKLSRNGIFPEHMEAATDIGTDGSGDKSFRSTFRQSAVRAEFYRAIAALLKAGLPMTAALEVMLEHPLVSSTGYTRDLAGIRDRIRDGSGLAHALQEVAVSISAFESAVIESGEKTGRMPEVLAQVADYLDDIQRIRQTLRTACLYPIVIIIMALLVGGGVMGFLVPQMAAVFEESGMKLPAITRLVIGIGHWFLPVVLPAIALITVFAILAYKKTTSTLSYRIKWEKFLARIPVVRDGFQLLVTTRFSRTCALLLHGGLPLVDTLELSGKATGSVWLAEIIAIKAESVRHGQSFSQTLAEIPILGQSLASWVRAGEASGDLAGLFYHASERNRTLWSNYIQRVVTFIEPALIILVAIFVLIIALAILLPILSLNQQLG